MNTWQDTQLVQLGRFSSGKPITPGQDGPYKAFGSNGVIGGSTEARHDRGVIVGRVGAYCGSVAVSREPFWASDNTIVIEPECPQDLDYLFYLLRNADLNRHAGGSAQPLVTQGTLKALTFRVPEPEERAEIGRLLRFFDDLIENNRRRVDVLEGMARAIYREWFVRFRFPGHENIELVDSALGPIPDGWAAQTLGDVSVNRDRHRRPLSKMQRQARRGTYPYYGAAKLIDWIDGWIFDGEYLLFAEDGSVQTVDGFPVLQLVEGKFWANNHTHILEGNGVSTRFLYLASERVPIRGYVTGAAQPKITQANLNRIPVVVGPASVHAAFDGFIDPLFDASRRLRLQTACLASTRDLLLPKMVTGQIDVSALVIDALVEGAVA